MTAGFVATVISVHDGDTLTVQADLLPILGIVGTVQHVVRLAHINAPELSTSAGVVSGDWLRTKAMGQQCLVAIYRQDEYRGRVDADVWLAGDSDSLSTQSLAGGYSVPYGK